MSEKHMQLCRDMIAVKDDQIDCVPTEAWQIAWEAFSASHPPEMILALWECYEEARASSGFLSCREASDDMCKAIHRVEELTNE